MNIPPRILVPLMTPGVVPPVQITITPVPQEEEEELGQNTDQYALELLAYHAIKAKNMSGLKEALMRGIDSTHVFSAIPFDDVANESLLHFAVKENFVGAVETLIFHHKRKNLSSAVMTAFMYAVRNNLIEIIRLFLHGIIQNRISMRLSEAFRHAVCKSQYDLAAEIIRKPGFNVNMEATWGMDSPLHIVIQQVELVEILLECGAMVDCRDRKGATPLISACSYTCVNTAAVLLQHGADPAFTSRPELFPHYSALHATYRFANKEESAQDIVRLLLAAGLSLQRDAGWLSSAIPKTHFPDAMLDTLRYLSQQPLSMKLSCCSVIRNSLRHRNGGRSILKDTEQLPIPSPLRIQITLHDLMLDRRSVTKVFAMSI